MQPTFGKGKEEGNPEVRVGGAGYSQDPASFGSEENVI